MRVVIFCHSIRSDWNHGNAHFLRGIATELQARGHDVRIFEPEQAWSLQNLIAEHGDAPLQQFQTRYPGLKVTSYNPADLNLDDWLEGAGFVIVHEWNEHGLVSAIGEHRAKAGGYRLFFHDTHHRSVTDPKSVEQYDLRHYDGVLAFGGVIRDLYLSRGWARRAWTWHEAADTNIFRPRTPRGRDGDLVWIGNWGDGERTAELDEFLLAPVKALGLKARIYGVRYPETAKAMLAETGVDYRGWLANFEAPEVFSRFKVTVHVPRRPYTEALPGIPTIRVFEALACGIPLVSAPWQDTEGLFTPGEDFVVARNGEEMRRHLSALLHEPEMARAIARRGLETIRNRHTCAHRVDELLDIYSSVENN